jgi:hypothetical protein
MISTGKVYNIDYEFYKSKKAVAFQEQKFKTLPENIFITQWRLTCKKNTEES